MQMPGPVAAGTGPSAKFPKTMESDSDEELDSEDLDESDGEVLLSYILYSDGSNRSFESRNRHNTTNH